MELSEAQYEHRIKNVEKIAKERRRQTHCKHGHEFTESNTYWRPCDGKRQCRICMREGSADRYAAKKRKQIAIQVQAFGRPLENI